LVSKMDARFQQFFDANAKHKFPLVETPLFLKLQRHTGF
jgi:hypothetical protein